jgi:hypothetical protein
MQLATDFRKSLVRMIGEHRASHSFMARPSSELRLNGQSIKAQSQAQDRRIVRELVALCRKIDADRAVKG